MAKRKTRYKRKRNNAAPLMIAGAGMILLAVAAFFFGPKSRSAPAAPSSGAESVIPAEVQFPAPELALTEVGGEAASLEDYREQVVLVNNWATWCPPCRAEMPELEAYYQAHKDQAFTLIGISAGDTAQQVQAFKQQNSISFPLWLDPNNAALQAFRNSSLPNSYVIDKTGTVRLAWTGAISLEMLEVHVTPLLNE